MPLSDDMIAALFERRIVVIDRPIDDATANDVMAQILVLGEQDPATPVTLHLHDAPGGEMTHGMAVYDTMRAGPHLVTTVGLGRVGGMSAVLLAGGTAGRYADPGAVVALSRPEAVPRGPEDPGRTMSVVDLTGQTAHVLAALTGQPVTRVLDDMDAGRVFTADQAVDYGLVDGLLDTHRL